MNPLARTPCQLPLCLTFANSPPGPARSGSAWPSNGINKHSQWRQEALCFGPLTIHLFLCEASVGVIILAFALDTPIGRFTFWHGIPVNSRLRLSRTTIFLDGSGPNEGDYLKCNQQINSLENAFTALQKPIFHLLQFAQLSSFGPPYFLS